MVLHSPASLEANLQKLYHWYDTLMVKSPSLSLNSKLKPMTMEEEQWEIRHTYKSNLPLEYDCCDTESKIIAGISALKIGSPRVQLLLSQISTKRNVCLIIDIAMSTLKSEELSKTVKC